MNLDIWFEVNNTWWCYGCQWPEQWQNHSYRFRSYELRIWKSVVGPFRIQRSYVFFLCSLKKQALYRSIFILSNDFTVFFLFVLNNTPLYSLKLKQQCIPLSLFCSAWIKSTRCRSDRSSSEASVVNQRTSSQCLKSDRRTPIGGSEHGWSVPRKR